MGEKSNNLFSFRVLGNVENPSESNYIISQLNRWKSQKILSKKISAIITDYILNKESFNVSGATLGEKLQLIEKIFDNTSDDEKRLIVNMILTITGSTPTFSPAELIQSSVLASPFTENKSLLKSKDKEQNEIKIETNITQDSSENKLLNKTGIKPENIKKTENSNNFNDFDNLYDPYS